MLDAIFYTSKSAKTTITKYIYLWTAFIFLFGAITALLTAIGVLDFTAFQVFDGTIATWLLFLPVMVFSGFIATQIQKN